MRHYASPRQNEWEPRVEAFTKSLENYGVPPQWSRGVALGMLDAIRRECWARCTDVAGSAEDIEATVGWTGVPCVIANLLVKAGILAPQGILFYMPTALTDAPQWARKRWQRINRGSHDEAKDRAEELVDVVPEVVTITEKDEEVSTPYRGTGHDEIARYLGETETKSPRNEKPSKKPKPNVETRNEGLFPPEKRTKRKAKKLPVNSSHHELIKYFTGTWEKKYAKKYPFMSRDAKAAQMVLQGCEGKLEQAMKAVDNYLKDKFYRGHPLSTLSTQLPRFIVENNHGKHTRDGEISNGIRVKRSD